MNLDIAYEEGRQVGQTLLLVLALETHWHGPAGAS